MTRIKFNYTTDFENIIKQGLSNAQLQLLKELLQKHNVDEEQLFYIMHKKDEAIGFTIGDRVLYKGYTHLRPNQTEFKVYEITNIYNDCLTDVRIKPVSGGESIRVYHRHLEKIN